MRYAFVPPSPFSSDFSPLLSDVAIVGKPANLNFALRMLYDIFYLVLVLLSSMVNILSYW